MKHDYKYFGTAKHQHQQVKMNRKNNSNNICCLKINTQGLIN